MQFVEADDAGAAAFHLFVVGLAFDIAHEHDAFQGFDVGAGGDHVDGDGDAVLRIGAEGFDGFFCFAFADFVGDLFAEGVAFIEDFAHGIDDAVAVVVVFGEDEGFGDPFHCSGIDPLSLALSRGERGY